MKSGRMPFRGAISSALLRIDMNEHGAPDFFRLFQDTHHRLDIVSVYRPQIGNAHIFKKHARHNKMFKTAFDAPNFGYYFIAVFGFPMQGIIDALFQIQIHVRRPDIVQIFGNTAHIFGNGHIVIIQDNDKICFQP